MKACKPRRQAATLLAKQQMGGVIVVVVEGQHSPGDTHLCRIHTRVERYKHVLVVSLCAEKRVGLIMGGFEG